jgi:hypothetical protein
MDALLTWALLTLRAVRLSITQGTCEALHVVQKAKQEIDSPYCASNSIAAHLFVSVSDESGDSGKYVFGSIEFTN